MASSSQHRVASSPSGERRAYEPPRIDWDEPFEPAGQVTGCSDVGDTNCPDRPET